MASQLGGGGGGGAADLADEAWAADDEGDRQLLDYSSMDSLGGFVTRSRRELDLGLNDTGRVNLTDQLREDLFIDEGIERDRMKKINELLHMIESQAIQGENCTPGTELDLGDKVVDSYAQVRRIGFAIHFLMWLVSKGCNEQIGQRKLTKAFSYIFLCIGLPFRTLCPRKFSFLGKELRELGRCIIPAS